MEHQAHPAAPLPSGPTSTPHPPNSGHPPKPTDARPRIRIGRIELRLTLSVVLMAALPLVIGIMAALRLARSATNLFYNPQIGRELDAALETYGPLVRALKSDMKHRGDAIAASEPLRAAAAIGDRDELIVELEAALTRYSDQPDPISDDPPLIELAALAVYRGLSIDECMSSFAHRRSDREPPGLPRAEPWPTATVGDQIAEVRRPTAIVPEREHALVQCKPLAPVEDAPMLVATFVTDRARIDRRVEADEFVRTYQGVAARRDEFVRLNVLFFAMLLGGTILVAGGVGFAFARSVSRRVARVAEAAERVAAGDFEVRVPTEGKDEVDALAAAFNRMVREVQRSRARIEYLQRVGAWQEMARRLAHEIKNPLTPILLAVEETHSRYSGDDPRMQRLLDTTLEVVTEEIGTLRRLVSEFSGFARLPHVHLSPESLKALLEEFAPGLERLGLGTEEGDPGRPVQVEVVIDGTAESMQVPADRQMLRKALDNLVRNAVQAIQGDQRGQRVRVSCSSLDDGRLALDVDDDGPGVPVSERAKVWNPYFTTRAAGTGLGLAIVQKIVVEHGGSVECTTSPLGGARFRIVLPPLNSAEARAAIEESERSRSELNNLQPS